MLTHIQLATIQTNSDALPDVLEQTTRLVYNINSTHLQEEQRLSSHFIILHVASLLRNYAINFSAQTPLQHKHVVSSTQSVTIQQFSHSLARGDEHCRFVEHTSYEHVSILLRHVAVQVGQWLPHKLNRLVAEKTITNPTRELHDWLSGHSLCLH